MPDPPQDAVIVVMDEKGYTDENMRGPAYMWTWEGGSTWYYVKDWPVPKTAVHAGKKKRLTAKEKKATEKLK